MAELTFIEMVKNTFFTIVDSEVFTLLLFEIAIILVTLVFSKLMDKKVVRNTGIIASLIVLVFYLSNYFNTVVSFVNNVATRLIELIYFPTTLEFVLMILVSFGIMAATLLNKKSGKVLKVINSIVPFIVSLILFTIIEFITMNNIPFDEFSVFTDSTLTSLYQLGMSLFITWIIGLIIYSVDMYLIKKVSLNKNVDTNEDLSLVTVKLPASLEVEAEDLDIDLDLEEEIELPRLKGEVKGM